VEGQGGADTPNEMPDGARLRGSSATERLFWVVGLALLSTQLSVGVANLVDTFRIVFRDAPYDVVPAALRKEANFVKHRIPTGSALVYVMRSPEHWQSRLWHRLLYPSPVLFLENDLETTGPAFRNLRVRYDVRFALSVGNPPLDPGFQWHVVFPARTGYPETWFGELLP